MKIQVCDVVKVFLKTRSGHHIELFLYVVPLVCESLCGQPVDVAVEQFPQLTGLDLAKANGSSDNLPVSILIGADCYWEIATGRTIHRRTGPTAVHTRAVRTSPWNIYQHLTQRHIALCTHILNVTSISSLEDSVQLDGLGIRQDEDTVYNQFIRDIKSQDGCDCVPAALLIKHLPNETSLVIYDPLGFLSPFTVQI